MKKILVIIIVFTVSLFIGNNKVNASLIGEDAKKCTTDYDYAMENYVDCCPIQGSLTGTCKKDNRCLMEKIYNCEMMEYKSFSWYKNWRDNIATDGDSSNIDLIIIMDISGSVNERVSEYTEIVTRGFVSSLKKDDKVGIYQYSGYINYAQIKPIDTNKSLENSIFVADTKYVDDESKKRNAAAGDNYNLWIRALDYSADELKKMEDSNKKVVIWLTDAFDEQNEVNVLSKAGIKFYVGYLFNKNISDLNHWGWATESANGHLYVLNENSVEEENKCSNIKYAIDNPGTCCTEYPETCEEGKKVTENDIIQSCKDKEYAEKYKSTCSRIECVGFTNTDLGKLLQSIFTYIKIGVIVLLIALGVMDFVKASSSSDAEKMKKAQKNFVIRLIIGLVIFFVPSVINFIFPLLGLNGTCNIK